MYTDNGNPYRFNYLITGITGEGIKYVYPEPAPAEDKILFKKEQKFTRPQMSAQLKTWVKEWRRYSEDSPGYVHAQHGHITAWEDQEWHRSTYGVHFWNNGVITYLTGFHYWYLTAWVTYFGHPIYRETDKEICYLLQFIEEDPECYGIALNTIRRYGKSSLMGAWIVYRATRNFHHNAGMQGETSLKIKKFYHKMVLKPFYKLPYYYQPTWNTDTKQTNQIEFDLPPRRGTKRSSVEAEEIEVLESIVDYRASSEGEYDGDVLNSYLNEEPGKNMESSIYSEDGDGTWDIVKPCLRKGRAIRGKAFFATTCEDFTVTDKGGKAYKKLFYDSDYNQRQPDGRTKSGLYGAFLPGDCAYEDYLDEWGHPMKQKARLQLMIERESFKNNPRKLAGHIRRYPLTITEIFYVSPDHCEFNATVIQDRIREIDTTVEPVVSRWNLKWANNMRFSEVVMVRDEDHGWFHCSNVPLKEQRNQVSVRYVNGIKHFTPKMDVKAACGCDPIQHGSNDKSTESRPVVTVKTKYDTAIDGVWTLDELIANAEKKHQYKTNRYVAMMHSRPTDPNVFFERTLMICWLFGISLHVEKQKAAIINYFYEHNCGDFIFGKYKPDHQRPDKQITDGTSASESLTQEWTSSLATYIDYFGHTVDFREILEDWLIFNAANTRVHDYTVATGFTELACKMKPKQQQRDMVDISELMPVLDHFGNVRRN